MKFEKLKNTEKVDCKVTQAELDCLADPLNSYLYAGVDKGFKYRMVFLLVMGCLYSVRLLFYPMEILPMVHALQNPASSLTDVQYLQFRAFYLMTIIVLYTGSYLKNWFFPQIALVVFGFAVAGFVMDIFNFYVFYRADVRAEVLVFLMLRIAAIVCLFYNALRAQRAPPMPRKIWA